MTLVHSDAVVEWLTLSRGALSTVWRGLVAHNTTVDSELGTEAETVSPLDAATVDDCVTVGTLLLFFSTQCERWLSSAVSLDSLLAAAGFVSNSDCPVRVDLPLNVGEESSSHDCPEAELVAQPTLSSTHGTSFVVIAATTTATAASP
jgi:hypothetical protein